MPEHTLAAYELGIREGADFIEPDVLITKDGILGMYSKVSPFSPSLPIENEKRHTRISSYKLETKIKGNFCHYGVYVTMIRVLEDTS